MDKVQQPNSHIEYFENNENYMKPIPTKKIKTSKMSLTEKLGEMGIPGFRSGNKLKMTIAIFGYFMVFLFLLALISPSPVQQKSPESTSIMPTTSTPTATIQATLITDDQKFATLLKESSKIIAVSSKGISDAAIREDYKSLELYGKYLKRTFSTLNTQF